MNLSAEYAPIYAHLDLHTLKKRALACLHTFVKVQKNDGKEKITKNLF